FDRDASGKLTPLPKPSIDTGAGLERLASVLQGVISNYDTDLFTPLIDRAAHLVGMNRADELAEGGKEVHSKGAASLRVLADYSPAATFLIAAGGLPSTEGRGYVLRKIIRRAITHGRLLGYDKPFLHKMVFAVRDLMQDAYPELKETADRASKTVLVEESRFAHTLNVGLKKLEEDFREIFDRWHKISRLATQTEGVEEVTFRPLYKGEKAFKLYDTFGMPLAFMQDA